MTTLTTSQKTMLDSQVYVDRARDRRTSVTEQWHNDVHQGVYRFCDQQPCHAIHLTQRYGC